MKNVSIFEKKWIDLVFEGKNKVYGAYQLRQENSKTSGLAFLFGLLFIASISGLGMLMSSFKEAPLVDIHPKNDSTIVVVNFPKEHPPVEKKSPQKSAPPVKDPTIKLPPVASSTPDPEPKTPASATPPSSGTPSTGTPSDLPPTTGTPSGGGEPKIPNGGTATTGMLDKQPEFPGGMDKFYSFVAKNFQKPDDVEGSIKVIVSFVIETDGTMTNIVVARNTNSSMADEAIRVLKSLKTKWSAGIIDGEKVRTAYSLPIVLKLEE